jgi:hypothetical protein
MTPAPNSAPQPRARALHLASTVGKRHSNGMPTILHVGPYRLFFYANDATEPIHVHVERESFKAKFWIEPVRLAGNNGFRAAEIGRIQAIVRDKQDLIVERWNEYFDA